MVVQCWIARLRRRLMGKVADCADCARLEVEEGLEAVWERVGGEEGEERGLVGEGRVDDDDEGPGPAVEEMREEVQAVEARGEWRGGAYVVTMMPVMEKVSALSSPLSSSFTPPPLLSPPLLSPPLTSPSLTPPLTSRRATKASFSSLPTNRRRSGLSLRQRGNAVSVHGQHAPVARRQPRAPVHQLLDAPFPCRRAAAPPPPPAPSTAAGIAAAAAEGSSP